jgi:hypothetical protein
MKHRPMLTLTLSLLSASSASAAGWYSGDPYSQPTAWPQYTDNLSNTNQVRAMTFDNFAWTGGNVAGVGGHFHNFGTASAAGVNTAYWEIRTGVANNTAGTLLYSGSGSVASSLSTFNQGGWPVWRVDVDVPDFNLPAGNYFFGLAIGTNDPNTSIGWFVASTTGANGVGGPLNDNYSVYYQEMASVITWNYDESAVINAGNGQTGFDPSYWITDVPSPSAGALLALAAVIPARRRRTR